MCIRDREWALLAASSCLTAAFHCLRLCVMGVAQLVSDVARWRGPSSRIGASDARRSTHASCSTA
eukprot:8012951-Alexandrium_andersonii.AAC.1